MSVKTWLKLGQILGFALMAAGVVAFVMGNLLDWPFFMFGGVIIYTVCRMSLWLREA